MAMPERTIELSSGLVLNLRAVSRVTLDEIVSELGGADLLMKLAREGEATVRAHFLTYTKADMEKYLTAQRRQLIYCCGWGVENDPPADALAEMEMLELVSPYPHVNRANWLIYVAGLSYADKARLIGGVMALTYMEA